MDWRKLFFSTSGRIGRKDFWLSAVALIIAGALIGWIPLIGVLARLVFLWIWIALYAKRLHDFGKSAWLAGLFIAAMVVIIAASSAAVGMGGAAGRLGFELLLMPLGALIGLGFSFWVGLSKGDPGPNAFGPPQSGSFYDRLIRPSAQSPAGDEDLRHADANGGPTAP